MLRDLHDNHPGTVHIKALVWSNVWWTGMDKFIEKKSAKLSLLPSTSEYASSSTDIFLRKSHIIMSKSAFRFCGANNGEDVFDGIWFLF